MRHRQERDEACRHGLFKVGFEHVGGGVAAEFAHCCVANLAYTLALQPHFLTNFGKGEVRLFDALESFDNVSLALVEHCHRLKELFFDRSFKHLFVWTGCRGVGKYAEQTHIFAVLERCIH